MWEGELLLTCVKPRESGSSIRGRCPCFGYSGDPPTLLKTYGPERLNAYLQ